MKKSSSKTLPLTRRMLWAIAFAYEEWNDSVTLPWLVRSTILFPEVIEHELTEARRKRRVLDAFRTLKRGQFVELRNIQSRMVIGLTDKGANTVLLETIRRGKKRTDGKVLLVSFDIPERARKLRCQLSYRLKQMGFKRLQKSLWATDKDAAEQIKKYLEGLGATSWIRLFEARAI